LPKFAIAHSFTKFIDGPGPGRALLLDIVVPSSISFCNPACCPGSAALLKETVATYMALKKAHKIVKETVATLPAPSLVNRRTDAEKLILARLDLVTAALPPADTDDKHDAPLACIVWFGLWTERFVTVGSVMQQAWWQLLQ